MFRRHDIAAAVTNAFESTYAHEKTTAEMNRFMRYLVDGVRSGPDFLVEQKLKAVRDILVSASAGHRHLYSAALSNARCSLLDDLRNRRG